MTDLNKHKNEILGMYPKKSMNQIAKKYGVCQRKISKFLKDHDVKIRNGRRDDVWDRHLEIKQMLEENYTLNDIGDAMGCTDTTIYSVVRKHGYKTRGKTGVKYLRDKIKIMEKFGYSNWEEAIVQEYKKQGGVRRTGEVLGCSHDCIRKTLKRMGVPRNPPGGNNRRAKS